jgi:dipeptidyl aminopeptidase/acylaminoacyl peptidase
MNLGSLDSIITSLLLTTKSVKFSELLLKNNKVYVCETRPQDAGRSVIYSITEEKDITPYPFSCKNSVHEYGGDTMCASDHSIYFTNKEDKQIYEIDGEIVKKLTDQPKMRFAELKICRDFLFAIFEDHKDQKHVKNGIVRIDRKTGAVIEVESLHDFYAGLTFSMDGKYGSFFTWDFPNMSWDSSDVFKVEISEDGKFINRKMVNKKQGFSSCDPIFSPSGNLYFVSDMTGFWNIYKEDGTLIYKMDADFSYPHWHMGNSLYTFIDEQTIACVYTKNAHDFLAIIKDGRIKTLDLPFSSYLCVKSKGKTLYFIAASPSQTRAVYSYDLENNSLKELKSSLKVDLDPSWISIPKEISFISRHGETSFAFFYPPKNPNYTFDGEKPPLILISHGGPTGHNTPEFKMEIQYWTSRGFAVCDVNYSGSTGFGREYRNRLNHNWGVKDVDDCEDCALFLANEGLVDKNRLIVRGASAGGYTTLALLTFRDTFLCGASYFGVSDLTLLAQHTHKFEARYLDKLIGPYPEAKQIYQERSPIYHTNMLKKPILILQGVDDKVVPMEQAEKMYTALLEKKIPTAYLLFDGEGHGFIKKENIIKSLESELYFYQTIFNQKKSSATAPLKIDNIKNI